MSDNTLPLPNTFHRIAVIGPNADAPYNQLGDYTGIQRREDVDTVLDGIAALSRRNVWCRYATGCAVTGTSTEGFAEALEVATTRKSPSWCWAPPVRAMPRAPPSMPVPAPCR